MQSNPNPKGRPVQSRQKKEPRATKKRTHRSGPGWREQKKQLKCARRDSNPGRGRSRGRPFFARPKPHHPTMRLGEVEHSKVSYLYQKMRRSHLQSGCRGAAAGRGAAAAPWPRTIKSVASSFSICGFRYLRLEGSYLGPQMAVGPVSRAKPPSNGVSHPNPKGRPVQSRQN